MPLALLWTAMCNRYLYTNIQLIVDIALLVFHIYAVVWDVVC